MDNFVKHSSVQVSFHFFWNNFSLLLSISTDDYRFLPLEQLLLCKAIRKSDVYSFGLSMLYFLFPECRDKFPADPFVLAQCETVEEIFAVLSIQTEGLADKWHRLLSACLHPAPEKRASVKELLKIASLEESDLVEFYDPINCLLRSSQANDVGNKNVELFDIDHYLEPQDFYYLWSITFPTKEIDKEKHALPPLLTIPRLIILRSDQDKVSNDSNSEIKPDDDDEESAFCNQLKLIRLPANQQFKILPTEMVNTRLIELPSEIFSPILLSNDLEQRINCKEKATVDSLPISIRELDFDYQCKRLLLFKALLKCKLFIICLFTKMLIFNCPSHPIQSQSFGHGIEGGHLPNVSFDDMDVVAQRHLVRSVDVRDDRQD